jgi:hypothetical protein
MPERYAVVVPAPIRFTAAPATILENGADADKPTRRRHDTLRGGDGGDSFTRTGDISKATRAPPLRRAGNDC